MKKLLITLLSSILLITGMISPVFSDAFVPSIGVREDVELISDSIIIEPDDCVYELIVTSYIDKDTIESDESKQQIQEAYEMILEAEDVSDLDEDIIEIAHNLGAETEDLVVRDLFDVTMYHREESEHHSEAVHIKNVAFTIKAQDLDNFVCLLVYHDGKWDVVKNVEVIKDENLLNVLTEELSPFALIVATDYKYVATAHGCIWHLFIIITMIITFVLTNSIRRRDAETRDKKKKNIWIRDIICLISLILSIIFYIFGTCKYDIYALIAELIIIVITYVYSHPYNKDDE